MGGGDPNPVVGYNVYRSLSAVGGFTKLTAFGPVNTTTYSDFQVNPGTQYFYEVTAVDSLGVESPFSSVANCITQGPP